MSVGEERPAAKRQELPDPINDWTQLRYKVVFTAVGWQVIDKAVARDPLAEFGFGPEEYERARAEARRLNKEGE